LQQHILNLLQGASTKTPIDAVLGVEDGEDELLQPAKLSIAVTEVAIANF
jgi:hypothetical protein